MIINLATLHWCIIAKLGVCQSPRFQELFNRLFDSLFSLFGDLGAKWGPGQKQKNNFNKQRQVHPSCRCSIFRTSSHIQLLDLLKYYTYHRTYPIIGHICNELGRIINICKRRSPPPRGTPELLTEGFWLAGWSDTHVYCIISKPPLELLLYLCLDLFMYGT